MSKAPYTAQVVKDAYSVLIEEDDLSPHNPRINDTLGRLVRTLSDPHTKEETTHILLDPEIQKFRPHMLEKLSMAESQMERFWAQEFLKNPSITTQDLKDFWYWKNYDDLVSGEADFFPTQIFMPDESICFVGSGPLPLTAIILNQRTGKNVTCIDADPDACEVSREFLNKAGFGKNIRVICADGSDYSYKKHPIVIVASLVPCKNEVMVAISEGAHACYVGLRSAEGLHTLLYDPVDETSYVFGCSPIATRTIYRPEIINTTLFCNSDPGLAKNWDKRVGGFRPDKFGWRNPGRPVLPTPRGDA